MRSALLSLGCVLLMAGCTAAKKEDPRADDSSDESLTSVVYAVKNIEEGEIISSEELEERRVEADKAPVDAFNSSNAVVGQVAAYAIPAGTIVSNHAIKPMEVNTGFEGKIPEGMRAITFGINPIYGVAGFVSPQSHVDICEIPTGAKGHTKQPAIILSDVLVVAVGETYVRAPGSSVANPAGSVTVAVSPADGVKLAHVLTEGQPYLMLRSVKEPTVDEVE